MEYLLVLNDSPYGSQRTYNALRLAGWTRKLLSKESSTKNNDEDAGRQISHRNTSGFSCGMPPRGYVYVAGKNCLVIRNARRQDGPPGSPLEPLTWLARRILSFSRTSALLRPFSKS
jgi:hypothetical protein